MHKNAGVLPYYNELFGRNCKRLSLYMPGNESALNPLSWRKRKAIDWLNIGEKLIRNVCVKISTHVESAW